MSEPASEPGNGARARYQQHLRRRLDHLLTVAAPAAMTTARQALVAHALRHVLNECERLGLASEATARLRAAGRPAAAAATPGPVGEGRLNETHGAQGFG
jgi:predicted DNA-binding protein